MKILIAGAGDTGTHLANTLSVENQDIVLIGTDQRHLADLDSVSNFMTFMGNPGSASDLLQCGAGEADLFVAVTPDENINLVSAQIAKGCGAKRCVARVDTPVYLQPESAAVLKKNGIDSLIYPEELAAEEICHFISHNWVRQWFEVRTGEIAIVGVRIRSNAPIAGRSLKEVAVMPRKFHVSAIKRDSDIIIPRGDTVIMAEDEVYFTVLPENMDYLSNLCGCETVEAKRIMITGAGRVTENLLEKIAGRYSITVIEPDRERCRVIASRFPKVIVVNARANDVSTLKDEGIDKCDIFLALTGSSETNIVTCMVAREHGVVKTVARIEELQYIPEAESLSIDKIINKKLINVSKILNVLIDANSEKTQCMSLDNAEIIELIAREGSRIVSQPIAELSLPHDITIGGLIRDGKGSLVEGKTQIFPGDHVMVFCVTGSLSKVEKLFR